MSISSTYLERWRAEREQQRRREQLAAQQLDRTRRQREAERQRQAREGALRSHVIDALLVRKREDRKQENQQKQQQQALLVEALRIQRELKQRQDALAKQQESLRLAALQNRARDSRSVSQLDGDRNSRNEIRVGMPSRDNKPNTRKQGAATPSAKQRLGGLASHHTKPRRDETSQRASRAKNRALGKQADVAKKRDLEVAQQQKNASREKQLLRRAEFRIPPAELPSRELPPTKRVPDARSAGHTTSNKAPHAAELGIPLPDDSPLSWLSTQGGFVVDENGNPIYLRGVTVTGLDTVNPAPNQTVAQALGLDDVGIATLTNGWGINVVRVPFVSPSILSGTVSLAAADLLQGLDGLIAQAEAAGCYVLLALKPGREANGILPSDDDYLCMRSLAIRYRDQPAVLYEPFASISTLANNWIGIAQAVIGTIRLEHPASLLFMGNGKGTASVDGLPLVFSSGDPIYNLVYTIRLSPTVLNTAKRDSLLALSERSPVFVSEWSDGGPDFGRSSALAADLIVRVGAGWAASNWNSDPGLVVDATARKFSATRWGMVVQRTLAQPVRSLLPSYGRVDQAFGSS